MKISPMEQGHVYTIYIILNDKETYQQSVATEIFTKLIKSTCLGYQVSYSTHLQEGGYIHENGEYIQEISAALTLIGIEREKVNAIASDLCYFFNQESVLIEERTSSFYSVSESLAIEEE